MKDVNKKIIGTLLVGGIVFGAAGIAMADNTRGANANFDGDQRAKKMQMNGERNDGFLEMLIEEGLIDEDQKAEILSLRAENGKNMGNDEMREVQKEMRDYMQENCDMQEMREMTVEERNDFMEEIRAEMIEAGVISEEMALDPQERFAQNIDKWVEEDIITSTEADDILTATEDWEGSMKSKAGERGQMGPQENFKQINRFK